MSTGKTYKQVLACCLLLLYFFIATPVQLWHYHGPQHATEGFDHRIDQDLSVAVATSGHSIDCPICAHQYAAYTFDRHVSTIARLNFRKIPWPTRRLEIVRAPEYICANKSPPAGDSICLA